MFPNVLSALQMQVNTEAQIKHLQIDYPAFVLHKSEKALKKLWQRAVVLEA